MSEAREQSTRSTPLYEVDKSLGAVFGDFSGWEMPSTFGSVEEEYRAVRNAAGLLDLTYLGAIKFWGKEAAQFLNGLITNNVKTLEKGSGMQAAFLTQHGKVIALCRVLGLGDECLFINEPQTHEKVWNYVFPFTYAGDFKAEDVSSQYRTLSVQGPLSLNVLKEVCFEPVPELTDHQWIETIIAGQKVTVVKSNRTGDDGYDVMVQEAGLKDVWDFILLKGRFHGVAPVGLEALDILRIEAGQPVYGIDVDESNMMLESGLVSAVSYTKGCYKGQEAVVMATHRGHVSKRLSGLILEGDRLPSRGDKVLRTDNAKEIGYITSPLKSEALGRLIAMAYVKYGFFEPGTQVQVATAGQNIPARVVELPFYKPHAR